MLTAPRDQESADDVQRKHWHASQVMYWESVAANYSSYYAGTWAQRENSLVEQRLNFLASMQQPLVIDLASGTGLGLALARRVNPSSRYIGVDISLAMLGRAPADTYRIAAAMNGIPLRGDIADAVLVLFTSCSFAYRLPSLVEEVARLLKPGGLGYISVLSRTALSRLLSPGNWNGHYRTRGDSGPLAAPVHRSTVREMRDLTTASGLEVLSVDALNAFSGVLEYPLAWCAGRAVGRIAPPLSHSLEITLRKPASEPAQ